MVGHGYVGGGAVSGILQSDHSVRHLFGRPSIDEPTTVMDHALTIQCDEIPSVNATLEWDFLITKLSHLGNGSL